MQIKFKPDNDENITTGVLIVIRDDIIIEEKRFETFQEYNDYTQFYYDQPWLFSYEDHDLMGCNSYEINE